MVLEVMCLVSRLRRICSYSIKHTNGYGQMNAVEPTWRIHSHVELESPGRLNKDSSQSKSKKKSKPAISML